MSKQVKKYQYKKGVVQGGYSFSVHNDVIILSEYVGKLEDDRVREAILFEAERARHHYVTEVKRLKTLGKKVNTYLIKQEATKIAKAEARTKFADVWDKVERIYETSLIPITSTQPQTPTAHADPEGDAAPCNLNKAIKFTVTVKDSDNIILDVTKESSS